MVSPWITAPRPAEPLSTTRTWDGVSSSTWDGRATPRRRDGFGNPGSPRRRPVGSGSPACRSPPRPRDVPEPHPPDDRAAGHSRHAPARLDRFLRWILGAFRTTARQRPATHPRTAAECGACISSRPGAASATSAANTTADMPSCSNFKSPCLRSRADIPTATWIAHPWHDIRNSGSPNTHLIHSSTGNETRTWTNRHRPNHRRPQPRGGQT